MSVFYRPCSLRLILFVCCPRRQSLDSVQMRVTLTIFIDQICTIFLPACYVVYRLNGTTH